MLFMNYSSMFELKFKVKYFNLTLQGAKTRQQDSFFREGLHLDNILCLPLIFLSVFKNSKMTKLAIKKNYVGIICVRVGQCLWIVKNMLVCGNVISWVTVWLHYNARQFITLLTFMRTRRKFEGKGNSQNAQTLNPHD